MAEPGDDDAAPSGASDPAPSDPADPAAGEDDGDRTASEAPESRTDGSAATAADSSPASETGASASDGEQAIAEGSSPAENLGFNVGFVLAAVGAYVTFVGPMRGVDLALGSGPLWFAVRDVAAFGPLPYVSGATLVLGLLAGLGCPLWIGTARGEYEYDLAIGLIVPSVVLLAAVAALGLVVSVVHFASVGELLAAGVTTLAVGTLVLVARTSRRVVVGLLFVVSLPLAVPSFVGVYAGSLLVGAVARVAS
jgi:hypothetical protein